MAQRSRNWKKDVDAIREVLLHDWDPIGCGVPDDEYDGYIPQIYHLMQDRVSVAELAAHLQKIETESMGVQDSPDRNRRAAQLLLALMEPTYPTAAPDNQVE